MANSEEEAEQIVQEHHTWGKPIDVEIVAEKNNN
jgi:(2Fe-2S) ferredoxin